MPTPNQLSLSDILTIVGTIASLLGAWWSWSEAKKSAASASVASKIKMQLINHRKTSELAELQALLATAQKLLTKYAASKPASLAGIDHHADSESIISFMHKLKTYNEYFYQIEENIADTIYNKIDSDLQKFQSSILIDDISLHGRSMLNTIVNFSPILKREFTDKREETV